MSEPSPSKPECAPAVGYIVNTWPRLSQTFVLNEILALEQRGVSLRIFSIKDPRREPVNAKVAKVRAPVTYLSFPDLRDRDADSLAAVPCSSGQCPAESEPRRQSPRAWPR